ncbi:MAG: GTPase HflX, partial [Anaerolineae bacterium]
DRLLPDESERTHELRARFPDGIPVSALTGEGLEKLIVVIEELLTESFTAIKVHIPYREGELVALFHQRGLIEEEKHDATGTTLVGRLPERVAPLFARYRR